MAVFAQLAVVGRGSNTCVYIIAIFTMCESTEQHIASSSCEDVQFLKNIVIGDESWVYGYDPKTAIVTVEGSHISITKEGAPGAKQNKGHVTGNFWF